MTFVKGKSGNPGGKEKAIGLVKTLAKEQTEAAIKTLVEVMNQKDIAPNARVSAAEALLNRAWGKPEQAVDLNVDSVTGITVNIVRNDKK